MIEWMDPGELRNHLTNIAIYGDTPDQELVASVKEHGVFEDHPIGYVCNGEFKVVVSGHRRLQAAKMAKQKLVPCVRLKSLEGDDLGIRERVILSNKHRHKTTEQMAREAAQLAEIESERARMRQIGALKNGPKKQADSSSVSPDTDGKTRKKVAKALDVSEATAQRLITAGTKLQQAEKSGNIEKAESIKEALSESAIAGAKAAMSTEKPAEQKMPPLIRKADNLLSKITGNINQASETLAPLVCAFDDIKSDSPEFAKKHKELLGHHSRLFQLCEDAKRVLRSLNSAWSNR